MMIAALPAGALMNNNDPPPLSMDMAVVGPKLQIRKLTFDFRWPCQEPRAAEPEYEGEAGAGAGSCRRLYRRAVVLIAHALLCTSEVKSSRGRRA